MPLADFILAELDRILEEWDRHAAPLAAGRGMDRAALRDEAEAILRQVVDDMRQPQSREEQAAKSKGEGEGQSVAGEHGGARHASGFTLPPALWPRSSARYARA